MQDLLCSDSVIRVRADCHPLLPVALHARQPTPALAEFALLVLLCFGYGIYGLRLYLNQSLALPMSLCKPISFIINKSILISRQCNFYFYTCINTADKSVFMLQGQRVAQAKKNKAFYTKNIVLEFIVRPGVINL
jgi:hypothetical protein